ncbi:MAG TPA: DUF192 domain-containing protein [Candidatus Baltobacteraceae bacterium]|jgi:hypothetical protein|nr:DUF192 domain-containing protein [Candidatus Baltobacteraceae bacterium]
MAAARLRNATTGQVIAENVEYADTWWKRFAGFIPKREVPPDDGLWFRDCWAIHTIGMRARIDVIFLDENGRVLKTERSVALHRPIVSCFGAHNVVELGAGALEGRDVLAGDQLMLE